MEPRVMADFAHAFALWLKAEGAYAAGIEQSDYDEWRTRHNLPRQTVARVTALETDAILHEFYWQPLNLAVLPQPWANYLLVEGSNLPWAAAVRIAQNALAWLGFYSGEIDGDIGPLTIAACQQHPKAVATAIVATLGHYATQSPQNLQNGLRRRLAILSDASQNS